MEKTLKPVAPLPQPLTLRDLKYPDWKSKDKAVQPYQFQLYYTERFGWCLPTLHIRNAGRYSNNQNPARTYAISVKDGSICRMGLGPHVKQTLTVYVRKSTLKGMQSLLDLQREGAEKANMIRDRISTRRANTTLRRMGSFY